MLTLAMQAHHGSTEDRPLIVIWEVTRSCMLACRHCRAEAQPRPDPAELNRDQWEDLLDQVAEIQPKFFIITGGDPASRPDILEIIAGATARGLRVGFSPSATPRLLKLDFDQLLRAGAQRMSLSLDGATPATHNAFRGTRNTWDWTMQAFTAARRAGIQVQINTSFSRSNLAEWPDFLKLIQFLRPVLWNAFIHVPTGRGSLDEMLTPEETEDLFQRLSQVPAATGIPVKTTEGPHFRRVALQNQAQLHENGLPWRFAPTNDGRGCVFISHTGDVQPSGFLPLVCGNVKEEHLLDIYRQAPVFRDLRNPDLLQGKCGFCEYRNVCGGSRARAYAVTGDYLAQEPTCPYQPARTANAAAEPALQP